MTKNKQILFLVLISLILVLMAACSTIDKPSYGIEEDSQESVNKEKPSADESAILKNYIAANLISVTDGDTIHVNDFEYHFQDTEKLQEVQEGISSDSVSIRFLAIDTPELSGSELYSEEAKVLTQKLLQDGKVILEIDDNATFDNYGRLLAHVYNSEGVNIQSALLSAGLARIAYLFDEYHHIDEYKKTESIAKNAKLNVHSIEGYVTEENGFNMNVVNDSSIDIVIDDIIEGLENIKRLDISNIVNEIGF